MVMALQYALFVIVVVVVVVVVVVDGVVVVLAYNHHNQRETQMAVVAYTEAIPNKTWGLHSTHALVQI